MPVEPPLAPARSLAWWTAPLPLPPPCVFGVLDWVGPAEIFTGAVAADEDDPEDPPPDAADDSDPVVV